MRNLTIYRHGLANLRVGGTIAVSIPVEERYITVQDFYDSHRSITLPSSQLNAFWECVRESTDTIACLTAKGVSFTTGQYVEPEYPSDTGMPGEMAHHDFP